MVIQARANRPLAIAGTVHFNHVINLQNKKSIAAAGITLLCSLHRVITVLISLISSTEPFLLWNKSLFLVCTSCLKASAATWITFSSYESPPGFMITICCIQVHRVYPLLPGWEVAKGFYDISSLKPAANKLRLKKTTTKQFIARIITSKNIKINKNVVVVLY